MKTCVREASIWGQGQVITSILWDVITCPCPWCLLLEHKSSHHKSQRQLFGPQHTHTYTSFSTPFNLRRHFTPLDNYIGPVRLTHWGRDKMAATLADNIFKCNFVKEIIFILITISLNFVPKCPINGIPMLVQIMAWRRPGDKPLSEPMMA